MIEKINRLAENLSKHGMKFTYHHHAHEFGMIDGFRPMDLFVDGFDKNNVTFVPETRDSLECAKMSFDYLSNLLAKL